MSEGSLLDYFLGNRGPVVHREPLTIEESHTLCNVSTLMDTMTGSLYSDEPANKPCAICQQNADALEKNTRVVLREMTEEVENTMSSKMGDLETKVQKLEAEVTTLHTEIENLRAWVCVYSGVHQ